MKYVGEEERGREREGEGERRKWSKSTEMSLTISSKASLNAVTRSTKARGTRLDAGFNGEICGIN